MAAKYDYRQTKTSEMNKIIDYVAINKNVIIINLVKCKI